MSGAIGKMMLQVVVVDVDIFARFRRHLSLCYHDHRTIVIVVRWSLRDCKSGVLEQFEYPGCVSRCICSQDIFGSSCR